MTGFTAYDELGELVGKSEIEEDVATHRQDAGVGLPQATSGFLFSVPGQ